MRARAVVAVVAVVAASIHPYRVPRCAWHRLHQYASALGAVTWSLRGVVPSQAEVFELSTTAIDLVSAISRFDADDVKVALHRFVRLRYAAPPSAPSCCRCPLVSTVACDVPHHATMCAHASDGEYTPISRKEDPQDVELPPLLNQLGPLLDNLDVVMKMLEATVLKPKLAASAIGGGSGGFSLASAKKAVALGVGKAMDKADDAVEDIRGRVTAMAEQAIKEGTGQLTQRVAALMMKALTATGASQSTVALVQELTPKLSVLLDMALARAGVGEAATSPDQAIIDQLGACACWANDRVRMLTACGW